MTNKSSDWLKPSEVAKLLRAEKSTVYRWIKKGYIKAVRLPSGRLLISAQELEKILAEVRR